MALRRRRQLDALRASAPGQVPWDVLRCAAAARRGRMYKCANRCVLCDLIHLRVLTRTRTAELYAMHLHHLCGTWTRVKEWHHRIATAGDLGDAPEGAQIGFEVRI